MKSEFSTSWISSSQPRKQRKFRYNAPLHTKHKFLSAHLSKELRNKYGKRSLPLRKGDDVLIMRGNFKKKRAKVTSVDLKAGKVALEGIQRTKKDGSKINVLFFPSVLQIQTVSTDDKERAKSLERKTAAQKPAAEKTVSQPQEKSEPKSKKSKEKQ